MAAGEDEIIEAFEIFDRDNDGKLSKNECASAIRALGKNPSSEELVKVFEGVGEKVDLGTFKKLYAKKMPLCHEQSKPMLDAFKALDKEGTGQMDVAQLRQILGTLGDVLSADEIDALFKEVGVGAASAVNYADFVQKLVSLHAVDQRPKAPSE